MQEERTPHGMSRRGFVQGLAGGSVAVLVAPGLAAESAGASSGEVPPARIRFRDSSLPVLRSSDVAVVGGSLAAVAAALEFARAGCRVVVIEHRTYLGREITATLRPWVVLGKLARPGRTPELIQECLQATGVAPGPGENPLKPDAVKITLEDLLLEAGVELIYASHPVGVLVEDERVGGLVIGNKSGRQVILSRVLVDATETAAAGRLAGAEFEKPTPEMSRFVRTLEFDHARPFGETCLPVPERLGIAENKVTLHRGYRGDEHVYVECPMILRDGKVDIASSMHREIEARHRSMRLASYLIGEVPQLTNAFLAATSYELHGRHTTRMAGARPGWASEFDSVDFSVTAADLKEVSLPLSSLAGPVRQLWSLQEAARLNRWESDLVRDPATGSLFGAAFAASLLPWLDRMATPGSSDQRTHRYARCRRCSRVMRIKEPRSPQRGRWYRRQVVPPLEVPVLRTVDVLVVGGGTSGATAAATSAREGMRTVVLDLNPGLGGTGTIGGVDSYWFGRRLGFAARVAEAVDKVHKSINYRGKKWNIEAKMYALLQGAQQAGAEVFFNAVTLGTMVEDNRVRGVVVATKFGVFAVIAKVVIDATGDGDVAAFAGAEFVLGSARDNLPTFATLAQFVTPGRNRNHFTSTADVTNVEDYTRYVLVGRRRGPDCHDHGVYIGSRETRHVIGGTVLSLTDQLRHKRWPDVVNIHYSNCDIKGKEASDWLRMGLIPPNLMVEIPYRALLPRGLENVLVAGKAFSCNHEALATVRMQADLENLGGVTALAAAQAVREGVVPRRIDLPKLQRRLVELGLLPAKVGNRRIRPTRYEDAQLRALIRSFDPHKPLHAYSDMPMFAVFRERIPIVEVCCSDPSRAVPILKQELGKAEGTRRVRIAQALAMFGASAAAPPLVAEIQRQLAEGTLPVKTSKIRYFQLPPDQAAMPEVAYLMYSLGMTRDKRSLAVWANVAELLSPTDADFKDPSKGTFYYVDAVCYGAELLGAKEALPILNKMHSHASLRDQGVEDHLQIDYIPERQAMLELGIGRALAYCGGPEGIDILVSYLGDNRAILAEFAHTTLVKVTGRDYGKDARAWSQWLKRTGRAFEPVPLLERSDG